MVFSTLVVNVSVPLVIVKSFRLVFVSKHFLTTILSPINEKVGLDCFFGFRTEVRIFFLTSVDTKMLLAPTSMKTQLK